MFHKKEHLNDHVYYPIFRSTLIFPHSVYNKNCRIKFECLIINKHDIQFEVANYFKGCSNRLGVTCFIFLDTSNSLEKWFKVVFLFSEYFQQSGKSALQLAARGNYVSVVDMLIKAERYYANTRVRVKNALSCKMSLLP